VLVLIIVIESEERDQRAAFSSWRPTSPREIRRVEDLQAALAHFAALLPDLKP
jgi:ferric-dicitrate binding protein FerR (iron transport regulator)